MKIVHISDIHIRNYKYYNDFDQTFDNLFKSLSVEKPDLIVCCGDVFNTKNYISGEAISLAKKFFQGLALIAPVKSILGNHDLNVNNLHRLSPVLPICEMIDGIELYLDSGLYNYDSGDIPLTFVVYSLVDTEKFVFDKIKLDPSRINIGLGHFCLGGSVNSSGFMFKNDSSVLSNENMSSFKWLDYIMLGDIHQQQFMDVEKRSAYAGSLLQNNHGESSEKGYLVWDITSKDKFDVRFVEVDSPLKFYTVEISSAIRLPKSFNPPIGSRIRMSITNSDLSFSDISGLKTRIISKFKPKDIREVYGTSIGGVSGFNIDDLKIEIENVRNSHVQSSLIREYFKDRTDISKEYLNDAININMELDTQIAVDSVVRNVIWNFEVFEFDNYFNYGEGNKIDFSKLKDKIVLIGGPNACGKSAINSSLVHTIFNTTKRNITRNYDYINSRKDAASGVLELSLGDRRYFIRRDITKLKDSKLSKTELDFYCIDSNGKRYNLNGEQRFDTEKNIRSIFGTSDDLFISSLSSQGDITSFIEKGATARKETLMKFLDLYFFEEKYNLVMDQSKNIRVRLKEYEEVDFDDYIDEYEVLVEELNSKLEQADKKLNDSKKIYLELEREKSNLLSSLKNVDIIDIDRLREKIKTIQDDICKIKEDIKEKKKDLTQLKKKVIEIDIMFGKYNVEEISLRNLNNYKLKSERQKLLEKVSSQNKFVEQLKKSSNVLDMVTCEGKGKFSQCPLISEATKAKEKIPTIESEIKSVQEEIKNIDKLLSKDKKDNIEKALEKINLIVEKKKLSENNISVNEIFIAKKNNELIIRLGTLKDLLREEDKHKAFIEQEEKNKYSATRLKLVEKNIADIKVILENLSDDISNINKGIGSNVTLMNEWINKKAEYENLSKKYNVYNMLLECFGKRGIPHKIITDKLPLINATINSLLDDVVTFRVELSHDDSNSIEVNLSYPDSEPRPLSIASGMEKMISSLAIRAGLCLISNLPRSSILIVDEGFSDLDMDHIQDVEGMLQKLKKYFFSIIIITHIDHLKDVAEMVIDISLDEDHNAHVNV